jgi:hypothetical protein
LAYEITREKSPLLSKLKEDGQTIFEIASVKADNSVSKISALDLITFAKSIKLADTASRPGSKETMETLGLVKNSPIPDLEKQQGTSDSRIKHSAPVVEKPIIHKLETGIGHFVTRNKGFKKAIEELVCVIQNYSNKDNPKRPLNIFITAAQGEGKSFLVEQISENIKLDDCKISYLEYQIGSFRSIEDLHNVFRNIQSINLEGKLPFIFFDEFASLIEDRNIYDDLLAPMWNGSFYCGT